MSELPEGWVEVEIGDLCHLINGRAFKPTDWTDTGLPIVRIQNLNAPDARFNHFNGEVKDKFIIQEGDLLFAWSGTPGTSFGAHIWYGPTAVLNQHIFKVEYDEHVTCRDFFREALNQRLDEFIRQAHGGVGLRHITKGKFEKTTILLPPLAEQRRIVEKLDALSAQSRAAATALTRIETLITRYKAAVLGAVFAAEYNYVAFEDVIDDGPSNGWSPAEGTGPNQAFSLKLSATTSGRFVFNDATTKTIPEAPAEGSKYWLQVGDVLIQRANSLEYVGTAVEVDHLPEASIYPDLMMRVRINDPVLRKLIVFYLNSAPAKAFFRDNATGTAGNMPKISGRTLKQLPVPLPPLEEQAEIVARIEAAFAQIETLARAAAAARARLGVLDRAILARAFKGKLVPQNPNDEPASELLKRVKVMAR